MIEIIKVLVFFAMAILPFGLIGWREFGFKAGVELWASLFGFVAFLIIVAVLIFGYP